MSNNTKINVFSVAQLNARIRHFLEQNYDNICIEAEVVNLKAAASGHVYFSLCDGDQKAKIDAVMWRSSAAKYGKKIKEGLLLLCIGKVTIYEQGGRYQFIVSRVEESSEGEKARALEELKKKLQAEGLFAPEKKRSLPAFPVNVGIVTSREGAALHDILKVASRRCPVNFLIAHASVQGKNAPSEIVQAISLLLKNGEVDVIIVGRGGGSSEDLDAFNDEAVIRAIASSKVPIVCAVGHEVDTCLAELAADLRAATPSEAAVIVVPDKEQTLLRLEELESKLLRRLSLLISEKRNKQVFLTSKLSSKDPRVRLRVQLEEMSRYKEFLRSWPKKYLFDFNTDFAQLRTRCLHAALMRIKNDKLKMAESQAGLKNWPDPYMANLKSSFYQQVSSLDALSPLASLARGYSIVSHNERIIKDQADVQEGQNIDITLHKGRLEAKVTKKMTS